jgi:tRNA (mo5U34)-methyltransferase
MTLEEAPSPAAATLTTRELRRRVDELDWYHTFDLPGAITTPGLFDHRTVVAKLPIPASLAGLRCLDAASADGFFAFELACRGATEVVSVDLADTTRQDWQTGPRDLPHRRESSGRAARAFALVAEATGLDATRFDLSIYDIAPEVLGTFDFVFMGNILLHLQDPARALQAVRSVTKTDGRLLSYEAVNLALTVLRPFRPAGQLWHEDDPQWWTPNLRGFHRMLHAGGWGVERSGGPLFQPFGTRIPRRPPHLPRSLAEWVFWLWTRQTGGPTAWALCAPGP